MKADLEGDARQAGLAVAHWHPGDSLGTRYRFFLAHEPRKYSYHEGDGIWGCMGREKALAFVAGFRKAMEYRDSCAASAERGLYEE